jgi:aspartyl-tRNA(Asn)/glutamyl-tRNA(Gln) amidotransferase subunit C
MLDTTIVTKIATLARIRVREEDKPAIAAQLSGIFGWIEQLQSVNTDGIEPMTSVVHGLTLPMREDVITDGHCREKVLANAPKSEHGCFAVPKVIE